jgi:predicted GNAT superfamily acetyltransferase
VKTPDCGTIGEKTFVQANHFLVEVADEDLDHYNVCSSPNFFFFSKNKYKNFAYVFRIKVF